MWIDAPSSRSYKGWQSPVFDVSFAVVALLVARFAAVEKGQILARRMKTSTVFALLSAVAHAVPTVDETYPYTGPAVPVGDWVDPSIDGNGKGFPRLVEPPAVTPATANPSNNVNVVALSYIPNGINIHYQTPFGLGTAPSVKWGTSIADLDYHATGYSHTYVFSVYPKKLAFNPFEQSYLFLECVRRLLIFIFSSSARLGRPSQAFKRIPAL